MKCGGKWGKWPILLYWKDSSLADRYCNWYSCDRFNRSFLLRFIFRIGFIPVVIEWTGLCLFRFKMTKEPGSSRSPKEEGGRSTRPLRNEQIMFSYSCQKPRKKFRIGAEGVSTVDAWKTIWNSNLSSQSRNRLCRDCNYDFRVLSPASRPCVGGVKLGDFSFVGNQTITQLAFWFYISNWRVPVF